jgi:cysteine desulfurase family protein
MGIIYMDNAATSFPKAPGVVEAVAHYLEHVGASAGRGAHRLAREAESLLWDTRRLLADLFGVSEPKRVVFALNVTQALNMALFGLLREGDHVVTTSMEHNSVMRPLRHLERVRKITVSLAQADQEGVLEPQRVLELIRPETRLVVMNHASNVTGGILPVKEVARLKGAAMLLVDAAQTGGAVPIRMEDWGVDLLAFTGHKSLLGPPGVGGLCLGPHVQLPPLIHGGTGTGSESQYQPLELPLAMEAGTHNMAGIAGLRAAATYILERGVESIMEHEARLLEKLLEGLGGIKGVRVYGPSEIQERVPVVSINMVGMHPDHLATVLEEGFGILVRPGLHCSPSAHQTLGTFPEGTVRISLGPLQEEKDVKSLLQALEEISSQFGP